MTNKRLKELNDLKERIDCIDEMLARIRNNRGRLKPSVFKVIFSELEQVVLRFWYGTQNTEIELTQDVLDAVEEALNDKRAALASEFSQDERSDAI